MKLGAINLLILNLYQYLGLRLDKRQIIQSVLLNEQVIRL